MAPSVSKRMWIPGPRPAVRTRCAHLEGSESDSGSETHQCRDIMAVSLTVSVIDTIFGPISDHSFCSHIFHLIRRQKLDPAQRVPSPSHTCILQHGFFEKIVLQCSF